MKLHKFLGILSITSIMLALACGKDRQKPPSNREGYTDGSIAAPDAPPKKDEKPAPDAGTPEEGGNAYVVEVGSFDNMPAAMKLSQDLRLARINNEIEQVGGNKFRVVVGKSYSRSHAERIRDKVIAKGFGSAKVASALAS